jgi:hypothetical protein
MTVQQDKSDIHPTLEETHLKPFFYGTWSLLPQGAYDIPSLSLQ